MSEKSPEEVLAELQEARGRMAAMQEQLDALRSAPAAAKSEPEQPRVYTEAELQSLVDSNRMSEEDMQAVLREQEDRRVEQRVLSKVDERERGNKVKAEIAEYRTLIPELNDKSSKEFQRVREQFQKLIARGLPENSLATEVAAVEAVFGSIDELRTPAPEPRRDTHRETGGRQMPRNQKADAAVKLPEVIESRPALRDQYLRDIDQRLFSGPDDPKLKREAELLERKYKRRAETMRGN